MPRIKCTYSPLHFDLPTVVESLTWCWLVGVTRDLPPHMNCKPQDSNPEEEGGKSLSLGEENSLCPEAFAAAEQ